MDLILYDIQPGGMGEDCLVLNIWTPTLSKQAKKPVLVHLHGGGWYAGTSNSPQFDGTMLARFGDAVVVTVNHRIGSFGFLDLADIGGAEYATSGVNGMLDLVAALKWVNENIESFGGDPSRVLVFGQSGGGAKTSTLLSMPSAKGLLHRAGVMSGSALELGEPAATTAMARRFLDLVGVSDKQLDRLHDLPFQQLLAAQVTLEMEDRQKGEAPRPFLPVVRSGSPLPFHPINAVHSKDVPDVPLIVGTTLDERSYRVRSFDLNEAQLNDFFQKNAGADADRLLALYRADGPQASEYLLQVRFDTDRTFRRNAHIMADARAEHMKAPVWTYLWSAPSPAYDGKFGATHGVDLGPSMYDIRLGLNGPADVSRKYARAMASSWLAFAANADPSNSETGEWPKYELPNRLTMVVGDKVIFKPEADPRSELRKYWTGRAP